MKDRKCSLNPKVMELKDWLAKHLPHGEPVKDYPKPQPPSYKISRLTCPCGATHIGMEEK